MAEEERWAETNPLISGSNVAPSRAPAPPRSWGEAFVDTGIDVARSVTGAAKQVAGVGEMAASGIDLRGPLATAGRRNVDTLSGLDTILKGWQSPERQQTEETGGYTFGKDPGKAALQTGIGILPFLPLAMAGPGAAPVFGALGAGQTRTDVRKHILEAPEEEIRQNPQYVDLRDQGLDDEQARNELAIQATDPRKAQTWLDAAPNVIGQTATGGAGGALYRGLTRKAATGAAGEAMTMPTLRSRTGDIAQRVADKLNTNWATGRLTGAGLGAGAGAIAGSGQEISRQWSEQTAGMQRTPTEWGKVRESGEDMAGLFGAIGAVGYRRPPRPARAPPLNAHITSTAADTAAGDTATPAGEYGPEVEGEVHGPFVPPRESVRGDLYKGTEPPEGSAPAPFAIDTPISRGRTPTGPTDPASYSTEHLPPGVDARAGLPPSPPRPHNISNDARYFGLGQGYDIWMRPDGRRQFERDGVGYTEPTKSRVSIRS